MFEVLWQDLICKNIQFFNNKTIFSFIPRYNIFEFFSLFRDKYTSSISYVLRINAGTLFFLSIFIINNELISFEGKLY
jgi:hypothetical protein